MKIAFIGTGVMGFPMVLNLVKNGYLVNVYNRTYEKAERLKGKATVLKSIKEAVLDADLVFTIVGYPKDVEEVIGEVYKYAKKGTIIVDMTTSSPLLAKDLHKMLLKKEMYFLDAPVTGGEKGAINASLSIMVGGDYDVYEKVLPVLKTLGSSINYMGESGNGSYMKLANQAVIAGNLVGLTEGLIFAMDKKLDMIQTLKILGGGSASSWYVLNMGEKIIRKEYEPNFFIKHFLKDLKLAKEVIDIKLENVNKVIEMLEYLVKNHHENKGTQALILYYLEKELNK